MGKTCKRFRINSVALIAALWLLPCVANAFDLSLDYSHHMDYYQGESVRSNFVRAKIDNKPRPDLEYYLYRAYGKTGDITTKDNGGFGIGYDPKLNERWSLWLDGSWSYDKALDIDSEIFLGGGPKYYVYKKDSRKLSLSAGVLHQERNPGDHTDQRLSFRVKGSTEHWNGAGYYQPNIDDSDDYIYRGEVEGAITKHLFFFWETLYRSIDDSQVTATGIRAKWKFGGKDEVVEGS